MQRGLVERFDASIGANTVLHPFGGATQSTPQEAMAANGLAPFTKVGGDFQSWIDQVVADTVELSKEIGVIQ